MIDRINLSQSFLQGLLGWTCETMNGKVTTKIGKLETNMADILYTHRSCNVAKWKDHGMQ